MAGVDTATGQAYPSFYTTGQSGDALFDFALTNQLIPAVLDGRNLRVKLLGLLYQRVKPVAGRFFKQRVRDWGNWAGVGSIAPEGNMPDPGRAGLNMYASTTRNIYGRCKFSGKMLRALRGGGSEAMIDEIEYGTRDLKDVFSIKQEIMLHNDGSGRRGEVGAAPPASTVLTVRFNQDHEGISTVTSPTTLFLEVGMRIAFTTAAGAVRVGASGNQAYYVQSKVGTNQVTLSLTLGGTAIANLSTELTAVVLGDWIVDASRDISMTSVAAGAAADVAWRGEPMGLEGVFRDVGVLDGIGVSTAGQQTGAQNFTVTSITDVNAGFQGIPVNGTVGSYQAPDWNKAVVADGGGAVRPISDGLIQRALSDTRRLRNGDPQILLSDFSMYDAYVDSIIGDKRFVSNTLRGGHDGDSVDMGGVTFNGMPWHKSRYYLGNRITGIDPRCFSIYENEPLGICAPPGNPQFERLHDKDAFWVAFVTEYQMFLEDVRQRAGFHLVDVQ